MKPYEPLQVTHANTKSPIYVAKELIFAYYFSQGHRSTVLLASGGAIIPVQESPEEIKNKINQSKEIGEHNNGTN